MPYHAVRTPFAFVSLAILASCGSCDCRDHAPLPGPSHRSFTHSSASSVSALGVVPFDVDQRDLAGPNSHDAQYGKTPEIVPVPGPGYIDVVLHSTDETDGPHAFQLRIEDNSGTLSMGDAMEIPTLGLVLGFTRAADGTFYYATGTYDDDVDAVYPAKNQHRSNVIRVYHYDDTGHVLFDVDLDTARAAAFDGAEALINPGVASSARLEVAGNVVGLVAGNNTNPDPNLNGTRHQKAVSTFLDATTGEVRAASSVWMSHSFDQRYLVDGNDLIELHLGDAYDRSITYTRVVDSDAGNAISVFSPKGALGDNNTFTRLGNFAPITGGASGQFLGLFATEHGDTTGSRINSSRDLALVHVSGDALDTTFGSPLNVTSSGDAVTNHVLFLTNYDSSAPGMLHAERPKLVALGGNQFLVLFERWTYTSGTGSQTFDGTYAMRIDGAGSILAASTRVSDHHLPRGDDAFAYGGGAAWITGNEDTRELTLHVVSPSLAITETVVP